jgi:oligopeptide transport system substrate-binding protein
VTFASGSVRPWLTLVLCTVIAACGRPGEDVKKTDAAPDGARTLVRGLGGEPETLDPRLAADNASVTLMAELYEGLTAETADGSVGPAAARSWTTSADGTTWTFDLRPGLRWSDGAPLTALHFARGIAKAKAADSQAPYAPLLAGIRALTVATDSTSLTVQLWRPMPYLPALLALPVAAPDPSHAGAASQVVGNGPYRLVARQPGKRFELERNPHYHGQVAIEHVSWLTLDDLDAELDLYRAGGLDITSEVPDARLDGLRRKLGAELHVSPCLGTYGYAVDLRRLDDPDARAALAMAIDRERITALVTGAGERAAFGWVAPGLAGYTGPRVEWSALDDDTRVAGARERWRAAAGRGKAPVRLRLCTDSGANDRRVAVAMADQWRTAVDVEVELVELESTSHLAESDRPGRCDLVRLDGSADYADPEAFLELFESRHPRNTAGYSSLRYDTLLYESRRAADAGGRLRRLAEAERVLLQDVAVIPVFHRVSKRLVKPDVVGVGDHPRGRLATRQLRWRDTAEVVDLPRPEGRVR